MLSFSRFCGPDGLRRRMLLVYALGIVDMVITKFLLGTGRFYELNPVMALAIEHLWSAAALKIVLPALLLLYLDNRLNMADARCKRVSAAILNAVIWAYLLVCALHAAQLFIM